MFLSLFRMLGVAVSVTIFLNVNPASGLALPTASQTTLGLDPEEQQGGENTGAGGGGAGLGTYTPTSPLGFLCKISAGRVTATKDTLYLDGGMYIDTSAQNLALQNEFLWKLDLTKSWKYDRPRWSTEAKPSGYADHYNGVQGTLWDIGDGGFYSFNGDALLVHGPPPGTRFDTPFIENGTIRQPPHRIFRYDFGGSKAADYPSFDPTSQWSTFPTLPPPRVRNPVAATSRSQKLGFVMGGVRVDDSAEMPEVGGWPDQDTYLLDVQDTISVYNFTKGGEGWSGTSKLPLGLGSVLDGVLVSLEGVGKKGILVFFGGDSSLYLNMRKYDVAWIYDIASGKWYSQRTTGDIPVPRRASCGVVVPAPDGSSHQIYMFGGTDFKVFDKSIYALTVPAFRWIRIPSKGDVSIPHTYDHACSLTYPPRNMLIIPGDGSPTCDKNGSVIIFDTTTWETKPLFDPAQLATPLVPTLIVDLIGGTPQGGAVLRTPYNGNTFDHPALGEIFSITRRPGDQYTESPGSDKDNKDEIDERKEKQRRRRKMMDVIAGVILGVSVILCGVLGYLFYRRRQKRVQKAREREMISEQKLKAVGEVEGTIKWVGTATIEASGRRKAGAATRDVGDGGEPYWMRHEVVGTVMRPEIDSVERPAEMAGLRDACELEVERGVGAEKRESGR